VQNCGGKILLTDADRRRLAVPGKQLGRKALAGVTTVAIPEAILRWYRELVTESDAHVLP
jgi:hypothetical protein